MFGFFTKAPKATIKLFNTKGRELQEFEPLTRGVMKLYSCGPTVYNFQHIGNLRAVVFSDIARRTFEYAGYKVLQVINITDFGHLVSDEDDGDDKMTVGLRREGMDLTMENMFLLASKYTDAYKDDIAALNVKMPHAMPRASEHVQGMIAYVDMLMHKGYAYKTSDGMYFDTAQFPTYGVLGGVTNGEQSRIGNNAEKHDSRDFALWKFNHQLGWDAPWGKGFPGWHIECTAMSTQYLGKSFDIHTGGIEHIAVHHNNEIAQAEAANDKPYARYWLHNDHIKIDGQKIAKSLGNSITLRQLRDRGISPLAYRYWLLTGHYRQTMNFTWDAVEAAQTALYRALRIFADLRGDGVVSPVYQQKFENALYNDLGTPEAIAVMWELIKDDTVSMADKRTTLLDFDRVLGIGFSLTDQERGSMVQPKPVAIPAEVQTLVDAREAARKDKDFKLADELRAQIKAKGYILEDSADGPTVSVIH